MAFKKLTYATGEEARINTVEPIRSKEDIKRIIQWFDSKKWHKYAVIFELGVNSGLRISDILGLKVADVQGAKIALREQKTGKVKMFPLKEDLQKLLADWVKGKPNDAWCFEGRKDRKLDRSQVYRRINEAIEALEIDANVGTHTLRKTFGYHHFRQYNNITLLQEIFNHTSPDVTKRYIGITQDEIDDTYLNLNLDRNVDNLKELSKLGDSRLIKRRVVSFCTNYIKNGGVKHKEFAEIILEICGSLKREREEAQSK